MSALFTLPKVISLPGAKLTFTQTGTTTQQNTYQDDARTTPHANPVVADAAGVFEPIFLDPTLPNYRVKLTTAADVLIYQEDGIPSNQNVQQSMRLESTNPNILLYDTDGGANQRKYRIKLAGNQFVIELLNDAESVSAPIFSAGGSANSFVGTLTGMTTVVTGTFNYRVVGGLASIWIDTAITGTSSTTDMTLAGMPGPILAAGPRSIVSGPVINNGALVLSSLNVDGSSTAPFSLYNVSGSVLVNTGAFTSSGTKGLPAGWNVTFPIG